MSTPHPRDQAVETLLARQLSTLEPEPAGPCPDAELMAAWVERGLDERERTRIEQHVSSCARCQAMAATLVGSEPVAEAVAPWWRRFDVRWLAPLGAAAAATLLWVIAPSSTDRGTAVPAKTMARVEAPAAPEAEGVAGSEVTALQDKAAALPDTRSPRERENAALQGAAPTEAQALQKAPQTSENTAAGATPDTARDRIADTPEGQTAARGQAAELAEARPSAPAIPAPAATANGRVAESAPAPAPAAAPAAPAAAFAGAARAEAPVRWRVTEGRVERGTLAGAEWTTVPTDQPVTAVAGVSAQVAWAIGREGLVLRMLDGRTWTRTTAPTSDDLAGITVDEAATATVRSVSGTLYRTTDGGATWTSIP